jgi:hypothetical protein
LTNDIDLKTFIFDYKKLKKTHLLSQTKSKQKTIETSKHKSGKGFFSKIHKKNEEKEGKNEKNIDFSKKEANLVYGIVKNNVIKEEINDKRQDEERLNVNILKLNRNKRQDVIKKILKDSILLKMQLKSQLKSLRDKEIIDKEIIDCNIRVSNLIIDEI